MAEEQVDNGEVLRLEDRKMLILYGSETGNSQDSAGDLESIAERLHFKTDVFEMNDVDPNALTKYYLVIFVVSTTGQGELPNNSQKFWRQLRNKRLSPTYLSSVRFTTFGLGDSSYTKYNWAVRKLHKRIQQLGAVEFYPRGEADERHEDGIDGTFPPWSISLRSHLLSEYPLPVGVAPISADVHFPPKIILELSSVMDGAVKTEVKAASAPLLDNKAAQFSHVDNPNGEHEEQDLVLYRTLFASTMPFARETERTAAEVLGGIDRLDRPNVLRDAASKYSLEDSNNAPATLPRKDLLPIPDSWTATITHNERVTPEDHWQDVRHLMMNVHSRLLEEADPKSPKRRDILDYKPGDVVVLYPKNFPDDVQTLIDRMEWNDVADEPFTHYSTRIAQGIMIEHAPKNCHPVKDTTLRQLLMNNYDITAIPKRSFFHHIKFFTKDPMHRDRLAEFADHAYTDEFYDYTSRPRRSILEVLQDFPTVKVPYEWVPSIFPIIRGREYSIASGGLLLQDDEGFNERSNRTRIELLIALVKYKTVLRKTRQGLCSRYIESLRPGTDVRVKVVAHQGLPVGQAWNNTPVLAIAPGTGIAPVRAFFWARNENPDHGPHVLFYGGRNCNADFYFEDEWLDLGVQVFTAFSRDQKEKIYVQDVVRREYRTVCKLVKEGAIIALCGSSGKMPEAVRLALLDALVMGGLSPDREAAKLLIHQKTHFWEEVW
ncbi:hypothetical protein BJ170DRAFT_236897 [Xylariales sp. AK1849]|nr:hypothetical protein BJ170DRAFT_236897 [Xylariales sp. AK1849]